METKQCDNYLMIYVSQISQVIMLYTLNLHGAICQLYLNITEKSKKK